MNSIHALGASGSMAAAGASAIAGGSRQIFEHMVSESGASLHLNTPVHDILPVFPKPTEDTPSPAPTFQLVTDDAALNSEDFDAVFLATPWHASKAVKSLEPYLSEPMIWQPYVRLHVTLFTTSRQRVLPHSSVCPTRLTSPRQSSRRATPRANP